MREYSKRPENQSRTSDSNPRASQQAPIDTILQRSEKKEKPNDTGLPDNLKSGVENLSGHSLDDVKVHYNSNKPAQLQALAYTQGTDIHVAPGQERHLPHEAWHVVQQKQGRVQPTLQLQGVNVNDDDSLEREADVMGRNALQMKRVRNKNTDSIGNDTIQMVKVYVIEDTNIFGTPKTTFLTAAAGRVNNKQAAADTTHAPKIVDEFHIATRARARAKATATATGSAPPVPDVTVDETIVLTSHGGAGWLLGNPVFGGYSPGQLARKLLDNNFLPAGYAGRITLSGCETAVEYGGLFGTGLFAKKSFAELFKNELINNAGRYGITLGNFEVKGTLSTAYTGNDGRLLVGEDGFQGNFGSIDPLKKFTLNTTEGPKTVTRGKEGKKKF